MSVVGRKKYFGIFMSFIFFSSLICFNIIEIKSNSSHTLVDLANLNRINNSSSYSKNLNINSDLSTLNNTHLNENSSKTSEISNDLNIAINKNNNQNEGLYLLNSSFSGEGSPINYTTSINGKGNYSNFVSLSEILNNQTEVHFSLPADNKVTSLNITIDDLWQSTTHTLPINESIIGDPTYTIVYTNNSVNTSLPSENRYLNWINFTITSFENAPISQAQIYIDNLLVHTFSSLANYQNYSYAHNFSNSESGQHLVNLTLIYSNLTIYQNLNFSIFHTNNSYSTALLEQIGTIDNPKITLHKSSVYSYASANFTIQSDIYLQKLRLFCAFSSLLGNFEISIFPSNGTGPNLTIPLAVKSFPNEVQLIRSWHTFDFSEFSLFLSPGEYYFVINASMLQLGPPTNYFDLYTTISNVDGSQNPLVSENGTQWQPYNKNFLYNIEYLEYSSLNISDIYVKASLFDQDGFQSIRNFSGNPLQVQFNSESDGEGPWPVLFGQFSILFQANLSCFFNFSLSIIIHEEKFSNLTQFIIPSLSSEVQWFSSLDPAIPIINSTVLVFDNSSFRYKIYFPQNWRNITITSENNSSFSCTGTYIWINSTLSSEFINIVALSDNEPILFNISPSRQFYSAMDEIYPYCNTLGNEMTVSLSWWQTNGSFFESNSSYILTAADFLDYNHSTTSALANETTHLLSFPSYVISDRVNSNFLTARIWWNNGSSAGSFLVHYFLKESATLKLSQKSVDVKINSFNEDDSLWVLYNSAENTSISNANITLSWLAGNYSIRYDTDRYFFDLFANPDYYHAGTNVNLTITFSHYKFRTVTCTVQVFILINTTFFYTISDSQIYFNQSLTIDGKWYTSSGESLGKSFSPSSFNISVYVDQILIDSSWWLFEFEQENNSYDNFFLRFYTDPFSYMDFLGEHSLFLILKCQNATSKCESQYREISIEIIAPPTYLEFIESNAYSSKVSDSDHVILQEFEQFSSLFTIKIKYQYQATYLDDPNSILPFNFGSIWGYIYDTTNNLAVTNFTHFTLTSSLFGYYQANFLISNLISLNLYQIRIFANTTNLAPQQFSQIELKIMPKWAVLFDYNDLINVVEQETFEFSGSIRFNNGTHEWQAVNQEIFARIVFVGKNINNTIEKSLYTDENAVFTLSGFDVPKKDQFDYVIISISFPESRTNLPNSFTIQIEITRNIFQQIFIPLIIIAGIVLIGIPIVILFGRKFANKYLKHTAVYDSMKSIPLLKSTFKLEDYEKVESSQNSLENITTLRIPKPDTPPNYPELNNLQKNDIDKSDLKYWEEISIPNEENLDSLETLPILHYINRTLKDFQEVFLRGRKSLNESEFFARKDEIFRKGILFEKNKDYYSALILYSIVYQMGVKFHDPEEHELLQQAMSRVKSQLTSKEIEHFQRRYRWIRTFFQRRPLFQK
ncbi:MAG: fucose-binding lectin II [Candidatus Lokiarchaeota archaeon]|nr:fucose-binding lectin II [Candidatus Harpocratesius repetitus]